MKTLIVIDMQNDFINGSLGTKEAEAIVPAVINKINGFDGVVIATRDTHPANYLSTQEGQFLPVEHCIEGTPGWEINADVAAALEQKGAQIINKPSFGSTELAALIKSQNPESIELIGLCTDICVVSNALILKATLPETPISVDSTCCAGVTPASHDAALTTLRMCQIKII